MNTSDYKNNCSCGGGNNSSDWSDVAQNHLDAGVAVSVIVPVYNVEKYLADCVDSILGQTFQDMEIILVDDGSSDSSGQMADDYAVRDTRVKVIHKENGGQSSARNAGVKVASGRYIYFCDADDYISRDAIEILYHTAMKNDLDMVLFNGDSFLDKADTDNEAVAKRAEAYRYYYDRKADYSGCKKGSALFAEMSAAGEHRVSVCLQLIRRAYFLENHLYFQEGIIYEDNLYSLKALLLADRVMFIPEKLFHRRVRAGSTMTSQEVFKNFYGYFVVYCEAIKFLANHTFEDSVMREVENVINWTFKGNASRIWKKLGACEKKGFRKNLPIFQRILLDQIFGKDEIGKRLKQAEAKNRELNKALSDIRYGYSFRIGRVVTWLPRKLRGGFKCLRQHGMVYTIKRVIEHVGINMGTGDFVKRK